MVDIFFFSVCLSVLLVLTGSPVAGACVMIVAILAVA